MKTLALSAASRPLAEYAAELNDEVVVLTERNRPVAAIVPLRNVDRESLALSNHPGFLALIERSRREIAEGKTLSFEEMRSAVKPDKAARRTQGGSRTRVLQRTRKKDARR
jgi:antitoxin (DNA-binding transcriptional repressor) of toxin-antitoxin stability system